MGICGLNRHASSIPRVCKVGRHPAGCLRVPPGRRAAGIPLAADPHAGPPLGVPEFPPGESSVLRSDRSAGTSARDHVGRTRPRRPLLRTIHERPTPVPDLPASTALRLLGLLNLTFVSRPPSPSPRAPCICGHLRHPRYGLHDQSGQGSPSGRSLRPPGGCPLSGANRISVSSLVFLLRPGDEAGGPSPRPRR